MSVGAKAEVVSTLVQAKGELCAMARVVDSEIVAVARAFEVLAGHADTILKLAASIVGCVENESYQLRSAQGANPGRRGQMLH